MTKKRDRRGLAGAILWRKEWVAIPDGSVLDALKDSMNEDEIYS